MNRQLLLALNEDEWRAKVCDLADDNGWDWQYVPDSRRCRAGWPDLTMWRAPRFILVELKTEKGRLTLNQETRIAALQACLNEVYIWRPRDWDTIVGILK